MKNPLVQTVSKWMLRAYIAWSVCADVIHIGGIVYLIFFQGVKQDRLTLNRKVENYRFTSYRLKKLNANDDFAPVDYALAA